MKRTRTSAFESVDDENEADRRRAKYVETLFDESSSEFSDGSDDENYECDYDTHRDSRSRTDLRSIVSPVPAGRRQDFYEALRGRLDDPVAVPPPPDDNSDDDRIEGSAPGSDGEEPAHVPGLLPFDQRLMASGPEQAPEECFGCPHVGTNAAPMKGTELERLIRRMGNGMHNGDPLVHARDISAQYEKKIRGPTNRRAGPNEEPLPPWNPVTIYRHLYHHNGDAECRVEGSIKILEDHIDAIRRNELVEYVVGRKNAYGERLLHLPDKAQVALLKDLDMRLKYMSKDPTRLFGYKKDRLMVHSNVAAANPFVSHANKPIFFVRSTRRGRSVKNKPNE